MDANAERPLSPVTLWTVRVLALVALVLSCYLSWVSLSHASALGCTGTATFDCDEVLASKWATVLGIPIGFLGAGCYLAIFAASWLVGTPSAKLTRWGMSLLAVFATAAICGAVWFTGLQFINIGSLCVWCMVTHVCGIALGSVFFVGLASACRDAHGLAKPIHHLQSVLAVRPGTPAPIAPQPAVTGMAQFALPVGLGLFATVTMIGAQHAMPGKTYETADASGMDRSFNFTAAPEEINPVVPPTEAEDTYETRVARRVPLDGDEVEAGSGETSAAEPAVEPKADDVQSASARSADTGNDVDTSEPAATEDADSSKSKSATDDEPTAEIAEEENRPSRIVELLNGKLTIDIHRHAYLGSPDAPHVVVEMFDYTCPHCRELHVELTKAKRRYRDQVVVVVMPVPLEKRCNRYLPKARPQNRGACKLAALSLAVADVSPAKFARYHDWLMKGEEKGDVPAYDRALLRAYDYFGRKKVRTSVRKRSVAQRVGESCDLFAEIGRQWKGEKEFGLPAMIAGDGIISGKVESQDDIIAFWEANFELDG